MGRVDVQNHERERAEVFDALGHPTRINILKLLSSGSLSFSELKKKTGIESSGHLQHHLAKLNGLITTDEHGNYRLSDTGNDALFTLQTVETASRQGKRRSKTSSWKPRILVSTVVAVLAVCLVASALYMSNIDISLNRTATQALNVAQTTGLTQYSVQNRYVCDVMTGSLRESGSLRTERVIPIPLASQEWFNYTAVVIPESNWTHVGYSLQDSATVPVFSPPVRNATYYSQGFLIYELEALGPNVSDVYSVCMYPTIGPDDWNEQVVLPYPSEELPPYVTVQTTSRSSSTFSGGTSYSFMSIVPIETFGNYTFYVQNTGNATIQAHYTLTTPIVTVQTKPLTEETYPAWNPDWAEERIVRIRQEPAPNQSNSTPSATIPDTTITALNTAAFEIACTMTIGALSIFTINHKKGRNQT